MVLVGRTLSPEELQRLGDDPDVAASLLFGGDGDDGDDPELDLDLAWHGIHFLLAGSAWEVGEGAAAAVLGGEDVGGDNGYGPARLLTAEAVHAVAAGLEPLDAEMLRARFDPGAMAAAEVYPEIWDEGPEVFDEYLAPHHDALRRFSLAAAADGRAVLLPLT
ncbi:YfbM family protein [Kineococcus sp. NUM-3379]